MYHKKVCIHVINCGPYLEPHGRGNGVVLCCRRAPAEWVVQSCLVGGRVTTGTILTRGRHVRVGDWIGAAHQRRTSRTHIYSNIMTTYHIQNGFFCECIFQVLTMLTEPLWNENLFQWSLSSRHMVIVSEIITNCLLVAINVLLIVAEYTYIRIKWGHFLTGLTPGAGKSDRARA